MDRPNKNRRPAGKQGTRKSSDNKSYGDRKKDNRPSAEDNSAKPKETRSGRGNSKRGYSAAPSKSQSGRMSDSKSYSDRKRSDRPSDGKDSARKSIDSKSYSDRKSSDRPAAGRDSGRKSSDGKSYSDRKSSDRPAAGRDSGRKSSDSKSYSDRKRSDRPTAGRDSGGPSKSRGGKKPYGDRKPGTRPDGKPFKNPSGNAGGKRPKRPRPSEKPEGDGTRLNKYLAHAGIASRREADKLIATGLVKVNGEVVTEMGYKVKPTDDVRFNDQRLIAEKKVYVLLNKPKDFITTVDDPQNRRTVMQLIAGAGKERLYPVGRLDRMTTGLLLFTNDGELAKRLTHPRYNVRKVYHVTLDQTLKPNHLDDIRRGITLDDGPIAADDISYIEGVDNRKEVGIEIHSGRNRIVRRIFEKLGYNVVKLDRVVFANLTKRNLKRGQWRHLTRTELQNLAMLGKGK